MAITDHSTPEGQARARRNPLVRNLPLLLALALVLVGLAGLLPLRLSTNATTTSLSIRRLEQIEADWRLRNLQLEQDIVALGSLDRIEREARQRLGLVPASRTLQIAVAATSSPAPHLPSRFLPPEPARPQSPQPWWRNLLDLLPLP
ncbi:MAG: hypothetical protein ACE5IZ_00335 [Dehalococcoidia bacterium]